ncbi:glycosyl hydrolase [Halenospora varia]|nr:glycosyl hydrolase [Halenospora varia]
MWSFGILSLLLGSSLFADSLLASAAASVTATFNNNVQYKFDTDGNAIDSTSGKIDFFNGAYVWYGLSFGCGEEFCGIKSWTSTDLQNWHANGYLFDPNTTEIKAFCSTPLSGNCGRPHIVYSEATSTYVLWVNANSPGYAVFTSSSPTSGYVLNPGRALVGYQPPGPFQAGDFSVAVVNGTGYLAYSLIDFTTTGASIWPPFLQSIYFQQLTPDLLNTTGNVSHVVTPANDLVDFEAESPDIFKRGDYYYITASNTCGFCTGTLLIFYRSKSPMGPWTRQIISADTCGGQTTGVLTLPNPNAPLDYTKSSYMHQADLVRTSPLAGTRQAAHAHQFQLLNFLKDGSVADLDCSVLKSVSVPIVAGTLPNTTYTGLALKATDSSGVCPDQKYTPDCNLPDYQLYQTFSTSKSGTLKSVDVNVAGDAPTGNLTITVFRFQNNTNFYTPRYVWETLATRDVIPSEISQAFESVTVPVLNATVKAGDRIGIALVSGSITPMCTMLTNTTNPGAMLPAQGQVPGGDRNLFAIGANQVSLRGKEGKTPPMMVLPGELRWFATIE